MYRDGVGVGRNEPEAIKWFKLAAEQNNAAARQALALLSHDLNNFAFVMPSFWLFSRTNSIVDGNLLFRRYSVITEKQNLRDIDSGATDRLEIISEPGSLTNSMIFTCHRRKQITDHLTVHLPEHADARSFKHDEWVSRLEIRILADNLSTKVEGEYIKGDLFIDVNAYASMNDFQKLLSASRLIIEFGEKNDRIVLAASDQFGSAQLGSFMREYLPLLPIFASGLRLLSTTDILNLCFNF